MKHTAEPWHAHGGSIYRDPYPEISAPIAHMDRSDRARDAGIYPVERDENAKRAVECVNACAGMERPAAAIGGLRANLQAAGDIVAMHSETIARLEAELARLRAVEAAAREAFELLPQYIFYAEQMREIGRGFEPTTGTGRYPDAALHGLRVALNPEG